VSNRWIHHANGMYNRGGLGGGVHGEIGIRKG
jgi:hypothetical protein